MDCADFRKIFPYFVNQINQGQNLDADLEEDWSDHLNTCKSCFTWFASEQIKMRGYFPEDFPCPHIGFHATHECDQHDGPFDCPHQIIVNIDGDWGIPIKDETNSMINIDNCPWCGIELKTGWPTRRYVEGQEEQDTDQKPPETLLN